jgi:flagellar motor switch protein FliG
LSAFWRKKLSTLSSEDYTAAGGVESIVEILNLVDRSSEKQIIESLEEDDPDLAEEIKKRMFVFEDIVMLDDRAIQKVLREVDTQELAKALKSVDTEVQDKIFRNMSKRAASMLKEDMEFMGPVRLKDVEEAQQKIVSTIRRLEDAGEIVIARSGEDELVV